MTLLQVIAIANNEDALAEAEAFLTQGDPAVDDLLAEWQDAIIDATLPQARLFLTLLFARYMVDKQQADPFLRRTGKMLRDIDNPEIESLTLLLSAVKKADKGLPVRFVSVAEGRTLIVANDGTTYEAHKLDARAAARVLGSARLLTFERDNIPLHDDLAVTNLEKLCYVFGRKMDRVNLVPAGRTGIQFDAKP